MKTIAKRGLFAVGGLSAAILLAMAAMGGWTLFTPSSVQGTGSDVMEPENFEARRGNAGMILKWDLPDVLVAGSTSDSCQYVRSWKFGWWNLENAQSTFWQDASSATPGSHSDQKMVYLDHENPGKFESGNRYGFKILARLVNVDDRNSVYESDWVVAHALWPSNSSAAPNMPTGLTATAKPNGIKLRWDNDDSDTSIRKFRIRRMNTTGPRNEVYFNVSNLGSVARDYLDVTADDHTSYSYFIAAVNNRGRSQESSGAYIDR